LDFAVLSMMFVIMALHKSLEYAAQINERCDSDTMAGKPSRTVQLGKIYLLQDWPKLLYVLGIDIFKRRRLANLHYLSALRLKNVGVGMSSYPLAVHMKSKSLVLQHSRNFSPRIVVGILSVSHRLTRSYNTAVQA